jgi:hypothetical protein
MARALHVRLDSDSEVALGTLRAEGLNDSQAVRLALVEARARRRQRAALRKESMRLAKDSADRKEIASIAAEFDGLTPAWPEN